RSVIVGNVLARATVPVTENRIVSLPVPATQLLVAVLLLAAVIASRSVQMPGVPISASEFTVIVAARAAVLRTSTKAATMPTAGTARILATAHRRAAAMDSRPFGRIAES